MSTPGAQPDQDPITAMADTEDDAYTSELLDEGYSPREREARVGRFGMTADEELAGEGLDERLAEEEPDPSASLVLDGSDEEGQPRGRGDADASAGLADDGDLPADQPASGGLDGELLDDEVGDARAGRLVEPDQGAGEDREKSAVALDAGIDGGAASAEEAAVHVVPDPEEA
ncbi:DUF5709 domain-containing protein [Quadrisphaera setariae]|uniref:DUF5709 domain-containing protein n=1 Tax=Quadrisphaera setariae TaxID=2593304 RepID=A0A5C8ZLF9_9ACTN|nr:DUF5709 domain-containing protein [Quadrisphaera setariae]TXR57816.1 hypothetical protein FMM08_00695 [Quadrisphaera setariae]